MLTLATTTAVDSSVCKQKSLCDSQWKVKFRYKEAENLHLVVGERRHCLVHFIEVVKNQFDSILDLLSTEKVMRKASPADPVTWLQFKFLGESLAQTALQPQP